MSKRSKAKNVELYFVLNKEDDPDTPYYEQFDTLKDAAERLEEFEEPKEIFKAELKSVGFYITKTVLVKK